MYDFSHHLMWKMNEKMLLLVPKPLLHTESGICFPASVVWIIISAVTLRVLQRMDCPE